MPAKKSKIFTNLEKVLRQFVMGKSYQPMNEDELMERLDLPSEHYPILLKILDIFVSEKVLTFKNERYFSKSAPQDLIPGLMRAHPRGFGFVQPKDTIKYPQDIFIAKSLMNNAIDGDEVEVTVVSHSFADKGPEGKVFSITKRSRTHVAGTITFVKGEQISAYVPLLGSKQLVHVSIPKGESIQVGDRIVMLVNEWSDDDDITYCEFTRHIGNISDPSADIEAALEEYQLPNVFPEEAIKEALAYGTQVLKSEISKREDFRHLETFTIDPTTAKDFDDALSLSLDDKGIYHLAVHIADASFYVKPGSTIDAEAQRRSNSVYFPGRCVPMLPESLSANLCSLKANVNRLTVSVLMSFDEHGNMLTSRVSRSVIKSAKRFTYDDAFEVLQGKKRSKHKKTLDLMVVLCGLLKRKRAARGSIEFALPDLVINVDEKGVPLGVMKVEYDITHQMVEEFMLKANETVAKTISDRGHFLTFRIHEEPSPEDLKDFAALANVFGFKLPDSPSPAELQGLFDEALESSYGQYLAISYIRRLKMAYYSPNNIGHYGLSLDYYCHFTSPIRRYVDITAHRILLGEPIDKEMLEQICSQCSDQERVAARAENSVILLKKMRLLQDIFAKDPNHLHKAIVTQVKPFGIAFDVTGLMLDGFIHVSELANDYFVFNEHSKKLEGRHTNASYHTGDMIELLLTDVNLISGEAQWTLSVSPDSVKERKTFGPSDRSKKSKRKRKPSKNYQKSKSNRKNSR
jgi:ribonuclease R